MYTKSSPRKIRYKNFHRQDPAFKRFLFEGGIYQTSLDIHTKIITPYLFLERNHQFKLIDEVDVHPEFQRMHLRAGSVRFFPVYNRKKIESIAMDNYEKYRGKCYEMCQDELTRRPELVLTKGWYDCPIWGKQQHWWLVDPADNKIIDPSVRQFPSKGMGEYTPYAGKITCEYCSKQVPEEEAYFVEHHSYCSYACYGHDVGF